MSQKWREVIAVLAVFVVIGLFKGSEALARSIGFALGGLFLYGIWFAMEKRMNR